MHGPSCVFWANLTAFSLQRLAVGGRSAAPALSTPLMATTNADAPARWSARPKAQLAAGLRERRLELDAGTLLLMHYGAPPPPSCQSALVVPPDVDVATNALDS